LSATKPIGNVDKYNIIGPCYNNLPPGARVMSRTRCEVFTSFPAKKVVCPDTYIVQELTA